MYDFPLLKAELIKAGIQLGTDNLCADSLVGIKAIFKNRKKICQASIFKTSKIHDYSRRTEPESYSLIRLHQHFLNCAPARSHGAEADCLALLRITSTLGQEWLDWVEKHCIMFSDCRKMWGWEWSIASIETIFNQYCTNNVIINKYNYSIIKPYLQLKVIDFIA